MDINALRIVQTLGESALKVTVVLAASWFALAAFRRSSASVRCWICNLALLSALLIPAVAIAAPTWSLPALPSATPIITRDAALYLPRPVSPSETVTSLSAASKSRTSAASADTAVANSGGSALTVPSISPHLSSGATTLNTAPNLLASLSRLPWLAWVLIGCWLAGVLLTVLRWLVQAARVTRATANADNAIDTIWVTECEDLRLWLGIGRRVTLVVTNRASVPLTWGLYHPMIILPHAALSWSAERRQIVLLHELAHISRWDTLSQRIALVACAVNWFNPLAWKLADQLSVEREHACDDQVLLLGAKSSDYAASLLEISRAVTAHWMNQHGILAMGQQSNLAQRVRRILDNSQPRHPLNRISSVSLLLILAITLLPLSTLQLSQIGAQDSTVLTVALPHGLGDAISQTVFKSFEDAHPGVTVDYVDSVQIPDAADDAEGYFSALQSYASSADLLAFTGYNLQLTPLATRAGYILDLTSLINSDTSFDASDFYPQMLDAYQWDNGTWAVPMGGNLVMLAYDKGLFDKAGIAYPDGHWTLDDFVNAINKLSVKDASGTVTAGGFANSGRIFREMLWRSLIGAPLTDDSTVPNQPQLSTPAVEAVTGAYNQLETQNLIGSDVTSAAMYVTDVRASDLTDTTHGYAALPGNRIGLLVDGLAISAGTQHPELAYDLLKFLSASAELDAGLPARKSIQGAVGPKLGFPADFQPVVDQALTSGITFADLRFTDYLNNAWNGQPASVQDAMNAAEVHVIDDLKAADAKKGTLALAVNEPIAPVLPAGKIALNFDLASYVYPLPTQAQWDKLIQDFTANDPQVGLIKFRVANESFSDAVSKSDCFYTLDNNVPTLSPGQVLSLDSFLDADPSLNKTDFLGNVLTAVQRDNKTYALPIDLQPLILRYNTDLFNAAHVPLPSSSWTVEQFANALQDLKQNSGGTGILTDNNTDGAYLLVLIAAYGGIPLDYRTNPATINFTDPATVNAIRQVLDLARSSVIHYTQLGNLTNVSANMPNQTTVLYPSTLNGFSVQKKFNGTDPNIAIPFPTGRQYNALAYQLGTAYISARSQNPEACYRFISDIAQHPELFSTMPVLRSLLNSPTMQSTTNPDVMVLYNQVATLLADPNTVPLALSAKGGSTVLISLLLQHWLFEAFDAYVLDGKDLDGALKDAEAYAKGFSNCTATLPPLDINDAQTNSGGRQALTAYIQCAEKTDSRLKPLLDPLLSQ